MVDIRGRKGECWKLGISLDNLRAIDSVRLQVYVKENLGRSFFQYVLRSLLCNFLRSTGRTFFQFCHRNSGDSMQRCEDYKDFILAKFIRMYNISVYCSI